MAAKSITWRQSTSSHTGPPAKQANRRAPAQAIRPQCRRRSDLAPDRVIYPDLGTSKIEFARYYERIADWIVPHVAGRPLTAGALPGGRRGTVQFSCPAA